MSTNLPANEINENVSTNERVSANNNSDEGENVDVIVPSNPNLKTINSINNNSNENGKLPTMNNNLMNRKDALYATPLRRGDRRKSPNSDNEKINNLNGCSDPELKNLMDRTYLNNELGENRIKDFLKDTAHMNKRSEPPGKEHIGSSFSYLARKEHFVNLVHQNVMKDQQVADDDVEESESKDLINLDDSIEPCGDLDETEKLINKLVDMQEKRSLLRHQAVSIVIRSEPTITNTKLNREWVLKKIAMSLEQKTFKKLPPTLPEAVAGLSQQQVMQNANLPVVGYLVLGSNGSGKTTICNDIINGTNGTKGILNRRLLSFYFVNSQNPDCHSLSIFIRNLALQILSFSSEWNREVIENGEKKDEAKKENAHNDPELGHDDDAIQEQNETSLDGNDVEFNENNAKQIIRQQSEPANKADVESSEKSKFSTHPKLKSSLTKEDEEDIKSPCKKSKIPVKIGQKSPKKASPTPSNESIQTGGGEAIADICDQKLQEDIAKELKDAIEDDATVKPTESTGIEEASTSKLDRPPPLPKTKDCRTILADGYYEMVQQNPEIFESLIIDNIEKNPDDCFKKAILFPLLELAAPKSALLMLIDSIDENYLSDGTLITTLKGKNNTKSRNIAELLSNHIHLLPKWLFLVCTAKKQNRHITKLFSGFKKLTLDDLRKSHVVKDVQQYIINRLNVDFRGINLNKEIIDSLNQLYIKSNGCLLYLLKVMNGIRENFFTFREIKMIPCTLYGLFLYLCQKSFNKKQYSKIRPILNILLACNDRVEKDFVFKCLKTHNYMIDEEEFDKRLDSMKNILEFDEERNTIKIFHNSFSEWLVDVKFSTKKFLCDLNEGHLMIAMHYTLNSDRLCPNKVRDYVHHLIKSAEYLQTKNTQLDILLILLESRANLNDCFYSNQLNCCQMCEADFRNDINQPSRTLKMIQNYLAGQLPSDFTNFLSDFFKPTLPTDSKVLKLLMETGINNLDSQMSCESSMMNSPLPSDKSQTIDSELAELLISSEKSCAVEQKVSNVDNSFDDQSVNDNSVNYERIDVEMHKGKAFIHILANDGNHVLMERALRACKGPIDLEIEDHNGQTPLNIAARNGHLEIVKLLLEYSWVII